MINPEIRRPAPKQDRPAPDNQPTIQIDIPLDKPSEPTKDTDQKRGATTIDIAGGDIRDSRDQFSTDHLTMDI